MKTYYLLFILGIIMIMGACQTNVKSTMSDEYIDTITLTRADVLTTLNDLNQAMLDRSEIALDQICLRQLSYGHSSGDIQDKAAFIDEVINGAFDYTEILMPNLSIELSGKIAVARFVMDIKGVKDGEPQAVQLGCVHVYQAVEGRWKLLMRQAYKL